MRARSERALRRDEIKCAQLCYKRGAAVEATAPVRGEGRSHACALQNSHHKLAMSNYTFMCSSNRLIACRCQMRKSLFPIGIAGSEIGGTQKCL